MSDHTTIERAADSDLAREVSTYLATRERTGARPVLVTIGRTTYSGAHYWQERTIDPGTRAYAEDKRSHTQRGFYLLGLLPPAYVRDSRTMFRDPTWPVSYYLAGYYPAEQDGRRNEHHPFGAMFQLFPDADSSFAADVRPEPREMEVKWL